MNPRILTVLAAALLVTLILPGCPKKMAGIPTSVQTSPDTVKTTVTDEKGEKAQIEAKTEGENEGKYTVTTDKGTATADVGKNKVSEQDVGIAFYPGSTPDTGINVASSGENTNTGSMVSLATGDPFDKVTAFYKGKYGKGNTVVETPESFMITINTGENSGKMIVVAPDKDKGGTKIMIQSMSSN